MLAALDIVLNEPNRRKELQLMLHRVHSAQSLALAANGPRRNLEGGVHCRAEAGIQHLLHVAQNRLVCSLLHLHVRRRKVLAASERPHVQAVHVHHTLDFQHRLLHFGDVDAARGSLHEDVEHLAQHVPRRDEHQHRKHQRAYWVREAPLGVDPDEHRGDDDADALHQVPDHVQRRRAHVDALLRVAQPENAAQGLQHPRLARRRPLARAHQAGALSPAAAAVRVAVLAAVRAARRTTTTTSGAVGVGVLAGGMAAGAVGVRPLAPARAAIAGPVRVVVLSVAVVVVASMRMAVLSVVVAAMCMPMLSVVLISVVVVGASMRMPVLRVTVAFAITAASVRVAVLRVVVVAVVAASMGMPVALLLRAPFSPLLLAVTVAVVAAMVAVVVAVRGGAALLQRRARVPSQVRRRAHGLVRRRRRIIQKTAAIVADADAVAVAAAAASVAVPVTWVAVAVAVASPASVAVPMRAQHRQQHEVDHQPEGGHTEHHEAVHLHRVHHPVHRLHHQHPRHGPDDEDGKQRPQNLHAVVAKAVLLIRLQGYSP
mmetsp:Transcript_20908/g.39739  ORF Transcript_20908/g.39739 Transcript_20908/m.39739 type:complete len:543 (+) Transcript_20908:525-2153(+)